MLAGPAHAACDADWVEIRDVRVTDGLRIEAVNHTPYPLTYTLRLRSRDYRIDGPSRVTRTLPPHARQAVSTLRYRGDSRNGGRYRARCDFTVGDRHAEHDDDELYLLPYAPRQSYRVLQGFGSRFSHTGREEYAVDFKMREGTPVHAARDGVVARIEESHDIGCWEDHCGRYANYIVVLHHDGTTGEYYHLLQDGALVEPGDFVRAGQEIGLSGNTGHTTMPHLHFAVYRAVERGRTQSLRFRFLSADGIVSQPRRGGRYPAATAEALEAIRGRGDERRAD